ncbi:MAG: hypothetical protein U0904_06820 [Candidatus Nanopelagicales bacterium]|nr:hypothetical protein [Candidatus Nanopelagicales bacterium]
MKRDTDLSARMKWASLGAVLAALGVGIIALSFSDENAIGPYGLIQALPVAYYVAIAVVLAVLANSLRWHQQCTEVMVTGVVALTVLVHGAATFVESEPRFPVAWLHSSFTESIISLGHPSPSMDARFSWPGFFSGSAALTDATGASSPVVWLKWAPIILLLAYLAPLLAIGRATLKGWRAPWIGVIVFVMADWVGQDYFSPQSVAFVLYLTFIAIVLTYLRHRDPDMWSIRLQAWAARTPRRGLAWLSSLVRSADRGHEPAETAESHATRLALLILLVGLTFALVATHQLTPPALVVPLTLLAVVGRLRPWPIVVFIGVAMVGWLSYAAEPFWSGHLAQIFGGIGRADAVVESGVGNRLTGSSAHLEVVNARLVFSLLVWGLAGLGAIRLWRTGKAVSLPLLILTAAPAFIVVSQEYGGEGILRLFFYSLPGAAMLIAALVSPGPAASRPHTWVAFVAVIALSFPIFLLAKWGNESFERISDTDLQLDQEFSLLAPAGSTIASLGYGGPTSYRDITSYNEAPNLLESWPLKDVKQVNKLIGDNPVGTYIVISRPQVEYGVENDGLPSDFANVFVEMLTSSGQYKIVYRNPSGVILVRVGDKSPSVSPGGPPQAAAAGSGQTPGRQS